MAKGKKMYPKYLSVVLLIMLMLLNKVSAQDTITILCDATFNPDETRVPDPFPGAYYRVIEGRRNSAAYVFERTTAAGVVLLTSPFSIEQSQTLVAPKASHNGEYIAFQPLTVNDPLTVWNITTDEVAELSLTQEEFDYLADDPFPIVRSYERLIWNTDNELVIQYFDPDISQANRLTSRTVMTITETPLQIMRGNQEIISYPSLPVLPDAFPWGTMTSPNENYAVQISYLPVRGYGIGARIQVYDNTNSLRFDRDSVENSRIIASPVWSPNEQMFFYQRRIEEQTTELVQVNITQGFVEDFYLQQTLDSSLGAGTTLSRFDPKFDSTGTHIGFLVYSPAHDQYYVVVYNIQTDEIKAICNPFSLSGFDTMYPFWVPGDRYFGYWNLDYVQIIDTLTGDAFQFPSQYFVGWIETP